MGLMSTSTGGVARRIAESPPRTRQIRHIAPVAGRLLRTLWLRERGVIELRWASITLTTMVLLGLLGVFLDPGGGEFDTLLLVASPASIVIGVVAWSRLAARFGSMRAVRFGIGPFVLFVAAVSAGSADLMTLTRPAAAPRVVLAMAFAAMTPGYPLAAALRSGASIGLFIAHSQGASVLHLPNLVADAYVSGVIVTLLPSTGRAIVVRASPDPRPPTRR